MTDRMSITGINTVAVVVSDRREALNWYRDVLGLEEAFVAPDVGHWIEVGPPRPLTRIHLCELEDGVEAGPTGITLMTDDIHGDYERLRERGVRFLYAPRNMDWGEWLCAFVDPDGNEFDLLEPRDPKEWTV